MFVAYELHSGYSDESMRFATLGELSKFFLANPDTEYLYRKEN
jgi:hypothetical protein